MKYISAFVVLPFFDCKSFVSRAVVKSSQENSRDDGKLALPAWA